MTDYFDQIIRIAQGIIDKLSFGLNSTKQFPQVLITIMNLVSDILGYLPPFITTIVVWFLIAACICRFLRW